LGESGEREREGAHLRFLSVELLLSASATCDAPSAPSSLELRLRTVARTRCQWLLAAVGNRACGDALERGEGLVLLETGSEVLGGLRIECVFREAVSEGAFWVSGAADRYQLRHRYIGVQGMRVYALMEY